MGYPPLLRVLHRRTRRNQWRAICKSGVRIIEFPGYRPRVRISATIRAFQAPGQILLREILFPGSVRSSSSRPEKQNPKFMFKVCDVQYIFLLFFLLFFCILSHFFAHMGRPYLDRKHKGKKFSRKQTKKQSRKNI
jgi:hypothetical protein